MNRPPHIAPGMKVVLFDGVCSLCSAWTQFLIEHNSRKNLYLCSIQSPQGRDLLLWAGLPPENVDTMVFIEHDRAHLRSDAFFSLVRHLDRPWSFLAVFRFVPRPLRDFVYNRIAGNRYALFGTRDDCLLPTPENRSRFIDQIAGPQAQGISS